MKSKSEERARSFLECTLQVMKGESSLAVKDVGQCTVDVVQDDESKTCSVHVRGNENSSHIIKQSILLIIL